MVGAAPYLPWVTASPHQLTPSPAASTGNETERSRGFAPRLVVGDPARASENLVLFGDNAEAMACLLARDHEASTIDLVYIDPPFKTGRRFDGPDGQVGYSDVWSSDAEFLRFLHNRLRLVRDLMSARGALYLHLDRKYGYLARRVIDRTIGREYFRNEITRIKCNPKNATRKAYGNQSDVIYFYALPNAIWNEHREPLTAQEIERQYPRTEEETGRRYTTSPLYGPGETKNGPTGQPWRGMMPPKGSHWSRPPAELDALDTAGRIEWSATGNPRKVLYADESPGNKIQDVWVFKDKGGSRDSYPTEKNLEMLERIVLQSSSPDSVVLDCFMGSGTTLVAAAKHGRRFVGIDESCGSIAATVERLTRETTSSFTVEAQRDFVVNDPFEPATTHENTDVRLPNRFANSRLTSVLAGAHSTNGTWHVRPLGKRRTRWSGVRDCDTHVIVVEKSGTFTALPLASTSALGARSEIDRAA
jgi:adenine-specific DNA-methyltransferase